MRKRKTGNVFPASKNRARDTVVHSTFVLFTNATPQALHHDSR
jgi:hypothetical protein